MPKMPLYTNNRSISVQSREVKTILVNLIRKLESDGQQFSIQPNILEDLLDRFLLWAGNLGAFHSPSSALSLDSRLSSWPEIHEQICEFLDDLREAIDDLLEIIEGNQPNRPLQDCITEDSEDSDIISSHECDILIPPGASYSDEAHQALEIDFKKHSNGCHAMKALVERLGNANAKRRHFMMYCRDHKSRLETEDERTEKQSSKATTLPPTGLGNLVKVEWDPADDEDIISLTTASTTLESAEIRRLPTLAELSPDGEPFECPTCFTLQSFRRDKAWKFHAFCDLKAYVCTVGGPGCEETLFMTRDAWFEHELKDHRSKYVCPLCGQDGDTKSTMISHIKSVHPDIPAKQISISAEANQVVPNQFDVRACPFCDQWVTKFESKFQEEQTLQADRKAVISRSRFKKHVASHQEQFAIFAVSTSQYSGDIKSESEEDEDSSMDADIDKSLLITNTTSTSFDLNDTGGSQDHESVLCDLCGETFSLQGLTQHMHSIHRDELKYRCACGKMYYRKDNHKRHVEGCMKPAQHASYGCKCDREYIDKQTYIEHLTQCNPYRFGPPKRSPDSHRAKID
ncbi:hypothetical protein F4806DRAFT_503248 [Annulohypoxylon nitens]|nr:hypothetical protein F4806DRAFT_503248 [Annulohypoxylon nitens]